jgi:hypothetical protein
MFAFGAPRQVGSAGRPFIAVVRRSHGGYGYKASKLATTPFIPTASYDSSVVLATYIGQRWTRRCTSFLNFGSVRSASQLVAPPSGATVVRGMSTTASFNSGGDPLAGDATLVLYGGAGGAAKADTSSKKNAEPAAAVVEKKARKKFTVRQLALNYRKGRPIVMVTAYDYPTAGMADR